MTKVSVFGQETEKKKPIEFIKFFHSSGILVKSNNRPSDFDYIQLLYKGDELDTILAWDNEEERVIYLGHWNDGFVE